MSGMFEVLAASESEERIAQREASDKLAAAVYDVRQEFGDFLFKAASVHEFRTRVALVKDDMMKVVGRHLPPVSGVMGRIATRPRAAILEKEFRTRQANGGFRKGAPFADYDDFADCTSQNSDKGDADAYCGKIKHQVEKGRKSATGPDRHGPEPTFGSPEFVEWKNKHRADAGMPPVDQSDVQYMMPPGGEHHGWGIEPGDPAPIRDAMVGLNKQAARYLGWFSTAADEDGDEELAGDEQGAPEGPPEEVGPPPGPEGPQAPIGVPPGPPDQSPVPLEQPAVPPPPEAFPEPGGEPGPNPVEGEPGPEGVPPDFHDPTLRDDLMQAEGDEIKSIGEYGGYEQAAEQAGDTDAANAFGDVIHDEHEHADIFNNELSHFAGRRRGYDERRNYVPENFVDKPLIPEGDWKGYQNSVDHTSDEVDRHVFVPGEHDKRYTEDPSKTNFVSSRQARTVIQYLAFCHRNNLAPTLRVLERHGKKLSPGDYLNVAAALDRFARMPQAKKIQVAQLVHRIAYKTAAPDYLQKAIEALTNLLNDKAQQFQEGIAPLQQSLQVVQQAKAMEQTVNPMGVTPPAGTVNVLPDAPGGAGMPGMDPAAAGMDPAAGGGAPADQSAPPPAAAAQGLAGGPPDPTQPDPSQMQMAASRRQSGHPKGQRRQGAGGVVDQYRNWQTKRPGLESGSPADVEAYEQERGPLGPRAKQNLTRELGMPEYNVAYLMACKVFGPQAVNASRMRTASRKQSWMGWGPSQVDRQPKVAGWDWDSQIEAYVSKTPARFACSCGNQMSMPGHHECKCGRRWNGYVIGTGGQNHEASAEKYLVREIPVREGVIVANRQAAEYVQHGPKNVQVNAKDPEGRGWEGYFATPERAEEWGKARDVGDPYSPIPEEGKVAASNEFDEEFGDDEFPSSHLPPIPKTPATPNDWAQRNQKNDYAPHALPRRKRRQPA